MLEVASTQRGCVADWQIRDMGASSTELRRLHRSPRWHPVANNVLAVAGVDHDHGTYASAAVLGAGRGAALSHESAAAWWGLGGFALLPAVTSQTHDHARARHAARVHDLVRIPLRWVTNHNGITIARPELVAYQLCGCVHPDRAERALDALWSMRLLSGPSARDCLVDLAKQGRDGTQVFRALLKARGSNWIPPASGLESRVMQLARDHGIELRRQVDSGGETWSGRVDFRDARLPVVLEVMSERYHMALSHARDDEVRRERLEVDGFVVAEVWDTDVWTRPGHVLAVIQRARRRATGAA